MNKNKTAYVYIGVPKKGNSCNTIFFKPEKKSTVKEECTRARIYKNIKQ